MCGRYATFGPVTVSRQAREALEEMELDIISEINQREPQYNIAPTQKAPVVVHGEGGYHVRAYRWGLVPHWSKDLKFGAKTINARADTVATKPSFREAFKKRRCLVPASGYFEWKGETPNKQPYFIHDPAGDLLMFAGLWEGWRESPDAEWVHTYAVITGEPGRVSGDIHDRQPVILPPDLWAIWCEAPPADAEGVLAAVPEADLVYHPVPKAVGSPKNDGPKLVESIEL
ncbi:SOS response-associated peptidase [Luteibacter jiangsuensis]|uniref:Abasic site processing protein n=1 Tax=Luteibacter jiangsuensis TaxID=637577 RepID=A0ABX0Q8P0_9GAMM|nr:SOS response-associated peptidase [Luteibacter jiangsuensis]NID06825.1 SOS response-associated peptidase [Luteibacter jiangsuensis]